MAKYLLALLLVHAFVLLIDTPAPANPNQNSAKHTQADQNPPNQPPATQKQESSGANSKPDQPESTANKPTQPHVAIDAIPRIDVRRDWVDCATLLVGILLVIVGAVTSGLIWYQAREMARATHEMEKSTAATERSAAAMEKSVKLQEAQLEQWIDTTDEWEVDGGYLANKIVSSTTLTISFGIVNPSKMLLTLRSVAVSVIGEQVVSRSPGSVLSPEGTPYTVEFKKAIAGADFAKFKLNQLTLPVKVSVQFDDAFGATHTQTIEYKCTVGQPASCQLEEVTNKKQKSENPN